MKRVTAFAGQALAALCVAAAPSVALACPVCFAAKDEANRVAFLASTVFLTALPPLMICSLIYWIARRSSELESEQSEALEAGRDDVREAAPVASVARHADSGAVSEPRRGELIPLRRGR